MALDWAILEELTDQEREVKQRTIRQHQAVLGGTAGAATAVGLHAKSGYTPKKLRDYYRAFHWLHRYDNFGKNRPLDDVRHDARKDLRGLKTRLYTAGLAASGIGAGVGALAGSVTGRIHAAHKIKKMRKAVK